MEEGTKMESIPQIKRLLSNIQKNLSERGFMANNEFIQECLNNKQFINFVRIDTGEYTDLKKAFSLYKENPSMSAHNALIAQLKKLWSNFEVFNEVLNTTMQRLGNQYENIAQEKIQQLENNITKSREMLGEQAGNANAKKYQAYAEKNRKSAFWLFWFSVAIMGSLAIFSAFALYFTEITSKDLFVRISLFFAILLPAFFMMRESKKLKDKEFQYTDMAYRIMTSTPYIDGLYISEEEKAKLKAELVKDFFGRPIECRDDGGLPPIENICEIIKACLSNCRRD
ncbi:MAG: hypothetical protein E7019_02575 [Alphaproteobacteria bacterium]|nr:hypothetical protein [Alphaproteobacteria bacterium]